MIEAGCAGRRRISAQTFPRVQAKVMVIPACGEKRCRVTHALHDLEAQHARIKAESTFQVSDFEMDVADADSSIRHKGSDWFLSMVWRIHAGLLSESTIQPTLGLAR